MKNQNPNNTTTAKFFNIAICTSFFIWMGIFYRFIFTQHILYKDATSYFNQIKYFVLNLSNGHIPFWNHWTSYGVTNEFFFRRICEFNPLYLFLALLEKLSLSFEWTYLPILCLYFLCGLLFFYLSIKKIFHSTLTAYVCFLILLFSSLGTRIFDSFILLVFVPMCGFFYHFISLSIKPKNKHLLGGTFFFLILLNTYIPFYFFVILATFLISFLLIYPKRSFNAAKSVSRYACKNKWIGIICVCAILIGALPGYHMMSQGKSDFLLPKRQAEVTTTSDSLTVNQQTLSAGGIVIPYIIESMLSNYPQFKLEKAYIPLFAFFILFLGLFTPIKKIYLFLIIWFIQIYIFGLNNATPVYPFLYKYLFFIKYFRNSIFFTWIALIPIFTLFIGALFHHLYSSTKTLSLTRSIQFLETKAGIILFSVLIVLPSLIPYYYLNQNHPNAKRQSPVSEELLNFQFVREKSIRDNLGSYIQTPAFAQSYETINHRILTTYAYNRFIVYDSLQIIDPHSLPVRTIEQSMKSMTNVVYIETTNPNIKLNNAGRNKKATAISNNSQYFTVTDFSPNSIKFKTNFEEPKLLVYTDGFDPNWTARINGQNVPVLKSNLSFKGLYIPRGENKVELRYSNTRWFYITYAVWFVFGLIFILYIKTSIRVRVHAD